MTKQEIDALWAAVAPQVRGLVHGGARRFFSALADPLSAFQLSRRSLCCIDGGITEGLHIAGSGALLDPGALKALVQTAGIEELTTHDHCGAFAKAFPGSREPIFAWGMDMAKQCGVPYRHIPREQMHRPKGFHNEVAVYYDASGRFNRVPGLPAGFTVTRLGFPAALDSLRLALEIAFGEQGFNERFCLATPFRVVLIAHPTDQSLSVTALEQEVRPLLKDFPLFAVKTSGFKTAWLLREAASAAA